LHGAHCTGRLAGLPSDAIAIGDRGQHTMASETRLLTVQFLQWVAAKPRSYREMREAWGSTCPLTCAWEDAIAEDLVRHGADRRLMLTERGRALLANLA
jgi:hypothetical protein